MPLTRTELLFGKQWLSNVVLPCRITSALSGTTVPWLLHLSGGTAWCGVVSEMSNALKY